MKDEINDNMPEVDIESTHEDNFDEPLIEDIEDSSQSKITKLQEKLKTCQAEKAEHLNDLQRAKAEFLNAKKRLDEEKMRDKERAVTAQVEKLLPLADSFQMAMSDEEAWKAVSPEWSKGVESIKNQLDKILTSYGVQAVNPVGESFDPNQHEAMVEVPVTDQAQDHTIISVIQSGYVRSVDGKQELIRPARVSVGVYEH